MGEVLTTLDMWTLQNAGDLLDLGKGINATMLRWWWEQVDKDPEGTLSLHDHCTGLVRLTQDDLFVGQDSWFFLGAMNRIMKVYDFALNNNNALGKASPWRCVFLCCGSWHGQRCHRYRSIAEDGDVELRGTSLFFR